VKIDRIADDLLNVSVTKNGTPVDFESDSAGIGSSMLDEICLDWQLGCDRNQVKLEANLPVKL
jgi:hypothetical protein